MGKIKCKFDKSCCLTPCPNGQHPMVGSASCRACKFYYSGGKDFVLCELTRHSLKTIEAKKTPRKPVKKVSVASRAHNKQIVAALWKELRRGCYGKVPLKTDWVPLTEQRLNSVWEKVKG